MDDTDARNAAEWASPANWHGGIFGIYSSRRDTRFLVPKRSGLGLTFNFGRPGGVLAVVVVIALLVGLELYFARD